MTEQEIVDRAQKKAAECKSPFLRAIWSLFALPVAWLELKWVRLKLWRAKKRLGLL